MKPSANEFVTWFRHASPYIHAHRGRTAVVAVGGELAVEGTLTHFCHDLALMNALGLRLVLVFGIRPQVDARLAARGVTPQLVGGIRVTDSTALSAAQEAAGVLRADIEAALSMGLANSPMAGAQIRVASGNFVTAQPYGVRDGVDFQYTGEVRNVDQAAIQSRLDRGEIVLIPPIGYSPTGELFNLFAQDVATEVAVRIGASKLMFLMEEDGVHGTDGELLRQLTADAAEELLQSQLTHPIELHCAVLASRSGVQRCHLIGRRTDGAMLLELFTRDGVGTMVSRVPFDKIRTATIDDIGGILELIQPLEEEGVLVRRSREKLEMEIDRFTVLDRDGAVIGCAALYPFADERSAELACLVVHPDYRDDGIGAALLQSLEAIAGRGGTDKLVVLTTQTDHWFRQHGFEPAGLDVLPDEKKALYNYQRNSKVLVKVLPAP